MSSDSALIFNANELTRLDEDFKRLGVPVTIEPRKSIHFSIFGSERLVEETSTNRPINQDGRLIDSYAGSSIIAVALKVMQKEEEFEKYGFLEFLSNEIDKRLNEDKKYIDSKNENGSKRNILKQIKFMLIELGNLGTGRTILTLEDEKFILKYCPYAYKAIGREMFEKYKYEKLKHKIESFDKGREYYKGKRIATN